MRMKNPPHPGRIIRQECIEPLNLTVTAAAKHLRVTRQALNNLVNERAGVSPEMAIRLRINPLYLGISQAQWISVGLIIAGSLYYLRTSRKSATRK